MPIALITLVALLLVCAHASATTVYHYMNENGIPTFTDNKPKSKHFKVIQIKCEKCSNSHSLEYWRTTALQHDQYHDIIDEQAKVHNLDIAWIKAVIHAESEFKADALSDKGAMGLMQLMPALAKHYQIKDAFNPSENIKGGAAYLAKLLKRFKGNSKLAAAAYNAGPTAVTHYSGVPPFAQTQAFVQRVDILRNRYRIGAKQRNSQITAQNATLNSANIN